MVVQESNSSFPSRVRGFTSLYLFKPNKRSSFTHLAGPELPDKDEVTASTCGRPGPAPAPQLLKSPPPSPSAADPAGSPPPAPPWASGSSLRPTPGSEHMASRPPAGPRPSHAPSLGPPISRAWDAHRTFPAGPRGAGGQQLRDLGPEAGHGLVGLSGDPTVGPGVCPSLEQDVTGPWEDRRRAEHRGPVEHMGSWPILPPCAGRLAPKPKSSRLEK